MLVNASVPGTDDWYLVRLCNQLGEGLPRMHRLTKYRDGDALIPVNMWDGMRDSYMNFLRKSRLHVVETIRDARTNRQEILGFRTAATDDESGDTVAWRNWVLSRMDMQSEQMFNDTADYGASYVATWLAADGAPRFKLSNGWDTATIADQNFPWLTEAGITVGYDEVAQAETVVLFRKGYYRVAFRRTPVATLPKDGSPWYGSTDWEWASDPIRTPWTTDCVLTKVSTHDGYGVYEKHLDSVDRINEITLNGLTLIVMQSFRQRAIQGSMPTHYPEGHPQAGEAIDYDEMFKASPSALWLLPETSKIWESAPTDVRPIYDARKQEVETLASLTATPQYVFQGDSANQSATGAELAREQLVFAVKRMNRRAGASLAQIMALGFQAMRDLVRADVTQIEVMFATVNPATLAERAESAPKFKAGGATQRWIDENVLQMTPAEMRLADQDRLTEAFMAAVAAGGNDVNNAGSNPTNG
jgi:hypothetical protein